MPFEPTSWLLGFVATKVATYGIDKALNKTLHSEMLQAAEAWANGLPESIVVDPDFLFYTDPNDRIGEKRSALQQCLVEQSVPTRELWLDALDEHCEQRRRKLGDSANAFLLLDARERRVHLEGLALSLSRVGERHDPLFKSAVLAGIREIAQTVSELRALADERHAPTALPVPLRPLALTRAALSSLNYQLNVDTWAHALGGELRRGNNWVGPPGCTPDDARFVAPPPDEIPERLEAALARWNQGVGQLSGASSAIVDRVADFHHELLAIHPFDDANGRTARVITDYHACALLDTSRALRLKQDLAGYQDALAAADKGNPTLLRELVRRCIDIARD